MEISLQTKLALQQKLAPQIIQSIEILQMQTQDLHALITKEREENPFLEVNEPAIEVDRDIAEEQRNREALMDRLDRMDAAWRDSFGESGFRRAPQSDKDGKFEAMQNTAAPSVSLQDFLFEQFNLLDLESNETIRVVGENIIYNIDERGYLPYSLEEILDSIRENENMEFTLAQVEEALSVIQSLDPVGIGARDLKECLLLQLDARNGKFAFERRLIQNHLEDIQRNKLPKITKETGETLERIKQAVAIISELDPKPGSKHSSEPVYYVVPDVIVNNIEGEYLVQTSGYLPEVFVSPRARELLAKHGSDPKVKEFIKQKIDSAEWLRNSIAQRQDTLRRISEALVKVQLDYLEKGIQHLKPLKMQEIADMVGIHVATVSRAISGKYVQTPRGISRLRDFFTGGTVNEAGEVKSTRTVKERIKEIVEGEDRRNPLSDEDIMKHLMEKFGLKIARRTVTKYRKALGIASSRQRKEY
ncbi:MAG: RNA polymerase factor sigma-54 [Planctomycetota bacterium]